LKDKKVLVRVDFNVPLDENLKITDDTRIVQSLPTIDKIIDDHGIPILMSHLGRPKGEKKAKFSLKPVADYLINNYGYDVIFADDCIGDDVLNLINNADIGQIVLLENLRFYKEEEANDLEFAKKLAANGEVFVNDAFGAAHRAHASTAGITQFVEEKYAGKLMLDELEYLGKALNSPVRPFVAIIGGSKISGKIDVIRNLMDKCNSIIIGGGMMFTFYKAMGYNIGNSILEADKVDLAKELIELAKSKGVNLLLPTDVVIADAFNNDANFKSVSSNDIPDGWIGMDISEDSIKTFSETIIAAKIIVWNGPMGVFEMSNFANGTFSIAKALATATDRGAISIVGGGDSVAAIKQMGYSKKVSHVSTGGGASLEFLEGKQLPGVVALGL
jgi:phosphoglycerate kinase